MPRRRKDHQPKVNPSIQPPHSAWPNLHSNQLKAQSLVAGTEWQLLYLDLQSHHRVNLERLKRLECDEKTGNALRGALKAIELILDLPTQVENWKSEK